MSLFYRVTLKAENRIEPTIVRPHSCKYFGPAEEPRSSVKCCAYRYLKSQTIELIIKKEKTPPNLCL